MQFFTVATLTALAASVSAQKAYIHNHCAIDVYLWSVSTDGSSPQMVIKPGTHYSEAYKKPTKGGGVSLKLSLDPSASDPITQFEYTLTDKIYYDISNVNCDLFKCPFVPYGLHMNSGSGCPTRTCAVGEAPCTGAYTKFNDDVNTVACESTQDIYLHLCNESDPTMMEKRTEETVEFGALAHGRSHRRHHLSHAHAHARK